MNFLLGGSGAALFVFALTFENTWAAIAALALMATGLGILFFKIGRPLRFLYVLRQPQRSWMAREAWLAGLFFPLATFYLLTNLLGIAVALLGPLAIRQIAIIVQGPSWADWHFIWLYLLASSAVTFVYFTAVLIWRLIRYANPPNQSLEPTAGRRDDRI